VNRLDGVVRELGKLPPDLLAEIDKIIGIETGHMPIVPTAGPQLDAYECEADEIFYGGSAGGGKSALAIGLALNEHHKSIIFRRYVSDAENFAEQALEIIGHRDGFNGQSKRLRLPGGRTIRWAGCNEEKDKQRFKGDPNDLYVFDEVPDFLESQYVFITAWNRTTRPGQRCRIVCTGNPPTTAEGLWVIKRWAPWLDPTHPKPAKSGEIRWFVRNEEDRDVEVEGPGEYDVGGSKPVKARSRTFIRARLEDNPDLTATDDYERALDALPTELRDAYRDGKFDASLKDRPNQMIPTDWIKAAQARWRSTPPYGIPMCAIGVDGARVHDDVVLAPRYDGYYPKLTVVPGKSTPEGTDLAALIIKVRRGDALPIIDVIESVGAQAYAHLKDMQIKSRPFRGYDESTRMSVDGRLLFANTRTEAYWRFREGLDPGQDGGSPIALDPTDNELVADLSAVMWEPFSKGGRTGVRALAKQKVIEALGRSPNRGDAVVMSWFDGPRAASHMQVWMPDERVAPGMRSTRRPTVNMGPRRVSAPVRRS
jgi:hypothetical protein